MKAREMLKAEKNLNKLSTRHRVQRTPGVNEIRAREQQFTNDAIITERRRTRYIMWLRRAGKAQEILGLRKPP